MVEHGIALDVVVLIVRRVEVDAGVVDQDAGRVGRAAQAQGDEATGSIDGHGLEPERTHPVVLVARVDLRLAVVGREAEGAAADHVLRLAGVPQLEKPRFGVFLVEALDQELEPGAGRGSVPAAAVPAARCVSLISWITVIGGAASRRPLLLTV